jgi:hypothetical protein
LKHTVETGFIAVNQVRLRLGGEAGESAGQTANAALILRRFVLHDGLVEHPRLNDPRPAGTPERGDHVFNQAEFDGVGWGEPIDEMPENGVETILGLALSDDAFGQEPVAKGVARRAPLSGFSFRPGGAASVGAGRTNTPERRHRDSPFPG